MTRRRTRIAAAGAATLLVLGVAACGDTDDTSDTGDSTTTSMDSREDVTTSTSIDPYHGNDETRGGKSEAGSNGGDANPDAEETDL